MTRTILIRPVPPLKFDRLQILMKCVVYSNNWNYDVENLQNYFVICYLLVVVIITLAPGEECEAYVLWFVCLSVCLSVQTLHPKKTIAPIYLIFYTKYYLRASVLL